MTHQPIDHYGAIGDLHTVALVSIDGSIDFLCAPHFDSPSIFAALLDERHGGRFQLAPLLEGPRCKQLYLPDTCVLLTRFLSNDGVAEVSDFMPIAEARHAHAIVRRAKTVRGEVRFRMICRPQFDYARAAHTVARTEDGVIFVSSSPRHPIALRLRTSIPMRVENGAVIAEFTLRAEESVAFVLEEVTPGRESPAAAPLPGPSTGLRPAFERLLEGVAPPRTAKGRAGVAGRNASLIWSTRIRGASASYNSACSHNPLERIALYMIPRDNESVMFE